MAHVTEVQITEELDFPKEEATADEAAHDFAALISPDKPKLDAATATTQPSKKRSHSTLKVNTRSTLVMPGGSIIDSTLGRALSRALGRPFYALGSAIGKLGKTVSQSTLMQSIRESETGKSIVDKSVDTVANILSKTVGTPRNLVSDFTTMPPPPPADPAPVIDCVIPVLFVGPFQSGKTSLIKSWVERTEPDTAPSGGTTSSPALAEDCNWRMDYFKKDFAFEAATSAITEEKKEEEEELQQQSGKAYRSVRVQLWDCSGMGPENSDPHEDDDEALEDWKNVLGNADTVLLTLSLRDQENPEAVCDGIITWKKWLDGEMKAIKGRSPNVELVLSQADTVTGDMSSTFYQWLRAGSELEATCKENGISEWHIVTSTYGEIPKGIESVDDLFCGVVERSYRNKTHDVDETEVGEPSSPPNKRRKVLRSTSPRKGSTSTR